MRLGDRRKTSRYDCTHPVKYAYAGAPPRMGLLNEISTGGVLLATHHPVPDDIRIAIQVYDPRSRTDVEVHGHVGRRTNDLTYGIAFVELSHDALELVNYLLTQAGQKTAD